jgi:hypothetical protein
MGESPAYTLTTLRAMYIGSRDASTLRPSMRVHAVVPGHAYAVSGRVVGLGTRIDVRADPDGALVEDIRPEWVTHAEVR